METPKGFVKFMHWGKDGGPDSKVWGFWPISIKSLFGVALLRFENGSRDAYHSHAFNSVSWVIKGCLVEEFFDADGWIAVHPTGSIVRTWRDTFHMVTSRGTTWVLTFRGPWADTWLEARPFVQDEYELVTLTHGRQEV